MTRQRNPKPCTAKSYPLPRVAPKRHNIVRLVFAKIRTEKLYLKDGKTGAAVVVQAVRRFFPEKQNFGLMDYAWCLSRFRRQRRLGLPLDRVVTLNPRGPRRK